MIAVIFGGTFGGYLILRAVMNTPVPIVVVTSGSMEPTIYKGDILFVQKVPGADIIPGSHVNRTGDVIIYETQGVWDFPLLEPVVHRVIDKNWSNGRWEFRVQGDANSAPDGCCDAEHPNGYWIPEDKIYGKVVGIIPKLGWVKLFLDQTGITVPLLVILAAVLVLSIVWDAKHPEKPTESQEAPPKPEERENPAGTGPRAAVA